MQDYEKLGLFYLGREHEVATGEAGENLLLYDAKDLTTHAMMVGMTGSGKTGLATTLIEEAAIDGIPSILIDPKGDLVNMLLQFPELRAGDFRPWIDESEALRKGVTPDELARDTAESWRNGLKEWGQDGDRIRRLMEAAEVTVYTPGNTAGRPLQVLRSFKAPAAELIEDVTALRERIMTAVSGLLGLMGLNADPIQSRDHILLSTILDHAWRQGRSLDLTAIIHEVQKPPFEKVGVFDLESFYPAKERFGLAMSLNNLIASPGFAAWMAGEPVDVQRLLHTRSGKPRISILYLAHLSDAERMFFVTFMLNEILGWMRLQSGTSSLRAILYMDEIFGYFPPTANPPSKAPMLTLLKQARAFGLGVVLSTQNPVDLDYKGLSNCGTWFIGRLQTERDKLRVIEGLEGAAATTGIGFDRAQTEKLISSLGKRRFLMRNVHDAAPLLFQSRWALSYLRGPLTLAQLRHFTPTPEQLPEVVAVAATTAAGSTALPVDEAASGTSAVANESAPPPLAAEIPLFYKRPRNPGGQIIYRAAIVGVAKLHFVDARAKLDEWTTRTMLASFTPDGSGIDWEEAVTLAADAALLDREPLAGAGYKPLPAVATNAKSYAAWKRDLLTTLYQTVAITFHDYAELKLLSLPDEPEGDFRVRVAQALREARDLKSEQLKQRYAARFQTLTDQIRRAGERVDREKAMKGQQKANTLLALGTTLMGAFLGRGGAASVGTVGRASTTLKSATRVGKKQGDIARAIENLDVLQERMEALQQQFDAEAAALQEITPTDQLILGSRLVRPRKTDLTVTTLGLCWTPWRTAADGTLEPA